MVSTKKKVVEGKAKVMFAYEPDPDLLIQHFKDDVTSGNSAKKGVIPGKGVLNNYISGFFMRKLNALGLSTHFIKILNMREQLVRKAEVIPMEVVVRNIAAGSITKRLGIEEGKVLGSPVVEFYYKSDSLGDPLLCEDHFSLFEWVDAWEIEEIKMFSHRVNDFLSGILSAVNIVLVDFKMEFGFCCGSVTIVDEISPDSCRLWDVDTGEKMDKDIFREDRGNLVDSYKKVATRLGIKF